MIFSSIEMERRSIQTNADYKIVYSVWKETSHKPLTVVAPKISFTNVCTIDTIYFDECFLFHMITGRHCLLYKFIVTRRFGTTAMLLRCFKVFWKKSAFFIRYVHNNTTMLLRPKFQNKTSTSWIFFKKFICWQRLLLFYCLQFLSFSLSIFHIFLYKWNFSNFQAQKLPRSMFFY